MIEKIQGVLKIFYGVALKKLRLRAYAAGENKASLYFFKKSVLFFGFKSSPYRAIGFKS